MSYTNKIFLLVCVCGNQTSHFICSNIFCDTCDIFLMEIYTFYLREAWCVGISINISAHQQHSICAREWIMRSALFWIESHKRILPARAPVCVRQTQHELWPRLSSWNARWSCEPIYMFRFKCYIRHKQNEYVCSCKCSCIRERPFCEMRAAEIICKAHDGRMCFHIPHNAEWKWAL
jgi:hypothetical protein